LINKIKRTLNHFVRHYWIKLDGSNMNRKLISLFITPMTGNGGDRVVLNLMQAFADLGFNVDLVVPEVTDYH